MMATTGAMLTVIREQKFKGDTKALHDAIYVRRFDQTKLPHDHVIIKGSATCIEEIFDEFVAEQKALGIEVKMPEGY
jgi:hypothetical protein